MNRTRTNGYITAFLGDHNLRYIWIGSALTALATIMSAQSSLAQTVESEVAEVQSNEKDKKPRVKQAGDDVFVLGRINVYDARGDGGTSGQAVSQSIISADDVRNQNRNTLDDALRTVPGVESSNSGGQRNERMVYVRGFDRWRVPLSIDGVRIYLPADNRLDYGRFLTPDLAEIQVHKGYASVLNGPGGMGGQINLVTRKPTKELEGELRAGVEFGNTGHLSAHNLFGSVGTRQDMFYLQASGSLRDSDGWFLSRKYDPAPVGAGGPVQGSGKRDFSQTKDWRINLKAGFTPNDTDEYVVSYTKQEGNKGAPYHVRDNVSGITPGASKYQNNWSWPQWDVSTASFNSHTQIGDVSYLKTKSYYNTFDNRGAFYDDYTFSTQKTKNSENSYYNDYAYGFSIEGGTELIPMNTLKTAFHYRRDVHRRWSHFSPDVTPADISPRQRRVEDTWSVAAENTFHATDTVDFVGGISYDWYITRRAEYYSKGEFGEFPLFDNNAFNWQGAAIWRPTADVELHASISSRTRFPTLFERYSSRRGNYIENPNLGPERATNYEIGGSTNLLNGDARVGGAIFYSRVGNAIESIGGFVCPEDKPANPNAPPPPAKCSQNQNIGKATYYGFEISGEWDMLSTLTVGGNYTLLKSELRNPDNPNLEPDGRPEHIAYLYAHWRPIEKLTITPGLELSSSRWASISGGKFTTKPGFGLANLNVHYDFNDQMSFTAGVRNIFDKHYELADGFPEPGRTFYLNSRLTF